MRKKSIFFPFLVILSLMIFAACQKEGGTGPAGPAGPAGPPGPAGPKGDSGVANITYSEWLTVLFEASIDEESGDTLSWIAHIDAPKLTQEILSQGEIKVYLNVNTAADPVIFPLPYFDGGVILNSLFFTDTIMLVSNIDMGTITEQGQTFFQYRYVLIPGGVLAVKPENVDFNNYLEMKNYLKLEN